MTTAQETAYFPPGTKATYNSSHSALVVRGYLNTFVWSTSSVTSLMHYGVTISPTSLAAEPNIPLFAIMPASVPPNQGGCGASQQTCAPCPDCLGAPGNADGCTYGTDPIVGGCIGVSGILLQFDITTGTLEYCGSPTPDCFEFGGSLFGIFPICTGFGKDYTWSQGTHVTTLLGQFSSAGNVHLRGYYWNLTTLPIAPIRDDVLAPHAAYWTEELGGTPNNLSQTSIGMFDDSNAYLGQATCTIARPVF